MSGLLRVLLVKSCASLVPTISPAGACWPSSLSASSPFPVPVFNTLFGNFAVPSNGNI